MISDGQYVSTASFARTLPNGAWANDRGERAFIVVGAEKRKSAERRRDVERRVLMTEDLVRPSANVSYREVRRACCGTLNPDVLAIFVAVEGATLAIDANVVLNLAL